MHCRQTKLTCYVTAATLNRSFGQQGSLPGLADFFAQECRELAAIGLMRQKRRWCHARFLHLAKPVSRYMTIGCKRHRNHRNWQHNNQYHTQHKQGGQQFTPMLRPARREAMKLRP